MWTLKNMGNKTQGMSFAMYGLWNKNKIRYRLRTTEFWVGLTSPVFIELAKLLWVIQCQNKYGNALDLNDHSCLFITETRKMFWCKKLKGYFGKVTKWSTFSSLSQTVKRCEPEHQFLICWDNATMHHEACRTNVFATLKTTTCRAAHVSTPCSKLTDVLKFLVKEWMLCGLLLRAVVKS